ncbi:MAG: hypothetical protein J5675_01950 [Bacteroidales bacterium]|nr:hypothetical protein [Bacteroidales bacterium]MBO4585346.1 hypothetical protein [Bacteroidales bacterium]
MKVRLLSLAATLLTVCLQAAAQTPFSGSLESSSIYGDSSPYIGFYSNNYLKLDYHKGHLSAGLQGEWYPSPLPGYDQNLKGFHLPLKYLSLQGKSWTITAGDFYEQIGSGILFRSWEDRNLGVANSIGGLRIKGVIPQTGLSVTVFSGAPRRAGAPSGYASTFVTGADINLQPVRLGKTAISAGASVLDRYEWTTDSDMSLLLGQDAPKSVLMYALRTGLEAGGFMLSAEYIGKGKDFTAVAHKGASNTYELQKGQAAFVEASWTGRSLSLTASWRYLDNMAFRAYRTLGTIVPSNTLNYLPALCQQQSYMLASLNPYETFAEGENGFRGDLYYKFRRGTALGGKYGMTFHAGGSWINALGKVLPRRDSDYLAYRDLNLELKRKWNRQLQTTLFVSIQENSPTHGNRNATEAQNVFVFESQYSFSQKLSLRTELQYLYSQEREKDWVAALAELGLAPEWSLSVSDMYNHGSSREHFWNVSASWSRNSFKCILGYGRNRAGMVCSGGVCRWQPEYKGLSLHLQYAF